MNESTHKLLILSLLNGVGPATLRKLALLPGFADQSIEQLAAQAPKLARALAAPDAWQLASAAAEHQCEMARTHAARIVSLFDAEFPLLLAAVNDAPPILYVAGTLPEPDRAAVAIIGTRDPTPHGALIAARISTDFAEHNWSVVSGLALGCDGAAHSACLDAAGHTVAVMAHGLQTITPTQHRALTERILTSGGALVSEFPFGQEPHAPLFARRDRTQAGLAHGVIMVQSSLNGGSLHAARAALDYERWLAVPYPTERDRLSDSSNIAANMVLAEGTAEQQQSLLNCDVGALARMTILRDKSGYSDLRAQRL
jgi:DNA processing protein